MENEFNILKSTRVMFISDVLNVYRSEIIGTLFCAKLINDAYNQAEDFNYTKMSDELNEYIRSNI